jgi:hypothetical protein
MQDHPQISQMGADEDAQKPQRCEAMAMNTLPVVRAIGKSQPRFSFSHRRKSAKSADSQ